MFRHIKTSTGLIIIFAAAVILFGGAMTYYYKMAPTTYDLQVQNFTITKKTASAIDTKDWKTYTSNPLFNFKYSFKYPSDYVATPSTSELDGGAHLAKSGNNVFTFGVIEGTKDAAVTNYSGKDMMQSVATTKTVKIGSVDATEITGKLGGVVPKVTQGQSGSLVIGTSGSQTFLIVSTDNGNATIKNNFNSMLSTFKFASSAATGNTVATTTAPTFLAYNNTTYGFGLTLPSTWSAYKVKSTTVEGEVATYYFTLPTTDPLYAQATSTADAGYAAPFVIGVMKKSEWTGSEDQLRDFGSKIGENADYVFTVSYWQAQPTDLGDAIAAQAKTIVDSFKLN